VVTPRKLILIEGPMGIGKTTCARRLCRRLLRNKRLSRSYAETAIPHPLDIGFSWRARHRAHSLVSSFSAGNPMLPKWSALVQAAADDDVVRIIESRFWQNSLFCMFLMNRTRDEVLAAQREAARCLAPLQPILFLLRPRANAAYLAGVLERREGRRANWVLRIVLKQPYCERRVLEGKEGFRKCLDDWLDLMEVLFEDCPMEKRVLWDPQADYETAEESIDASLALSAVPSTIWSPTFLYYKWRSRRRDGAG